MNIHKINFIYCNAKLMMVCIRLFYSLQLKVHDDKLECLSLASFLELGLYFKVKQELRIEV